MTKILIRPFFLPMESRVKDGSQFSKFLTQLSPTVARIYMPYSDVKRCTHIRGIKKLEKDFSDF